MPEVKLTEEQIDKISDRVIEKIGKDKETQEKLGKSLISTIEPFLKQSGALDLLKSLGVDISGYFK